MLRLLRLRFLTALLAILAAKHGSTVVPTWCKGRKDEAVRNQETESVGRDESHDNWTLAFESTMTHPGR